ncbi:hypothetical protein R6Z07F_001331 [Ovis aries]
MRMKTFLRVKVEMPTTPADANWDRLRQFSSRTGSLPGSSSVAFAVLFSPTYAGADSLGAVACAAGGGSVCASERNTAGRARAGTGLAILAWRAQRSLGPSLHRRTPRALGLAGSGSPSLPQPALPPETRRQPRPWLRRAFRLLLGAATAPRAPRPQAAGRESVRTRGPPPRAGDPPGTGRRRAPLAPRLAPAGDGPLGTCGLSGAGTWQGYDRRLPPGRNGRENGGVWW